MNAEKLKQLEAHVRIGGKVGKITILVYIIATDVLV